MPCACGGGPGGKEDQGPGQGRGGSGHLAEKHEAWSGPNSAGVLLAASETESWAGPGGRTHLAEERAVWPGLRSQQDPVCRPCAEGQPQVPRHRHRHVAAKVPAEGAVAKETVGLGHGCREEGAGHRPPQEQSAPCRPRPSRALTEPTVSAAKAHRTVAAEAAPPLCAAAVVLARVRVAEVELGLAAWGRQARGAWERGAQRWNDLGSAGSASGHDLSPVSPRVGLDRGWPVQARCRSCRCACLPPEETCAGPSRPLDRGCLPAVVPLLATKAAMSTWRPSMCRSRMQPMKSLWNTGKFSGRLGTPPRSRGPVRSRDLGARGPGHWWDWSPSRVAPGGVIGSVGVGLRGH